jgi:hypothetical protein
MSEIMRRRAFITLFGGAAAMWPLSARAQAASRLWKIGVLANEPWPPLEGLRHGLRDLGYVEGKSHRFEYRFAQGRTERFPALASELVNFDVIIAWGTPFWVFWTSGLRGMGSHFIPTRRAFQSRRAYGHQHDTDCHVCRRPYRYWYRFQSCAPGRERHRDVSANGRATSLTR